MALYQKMVGKLTWALARVAVFCLPRYGKRAIFLTTLFIEISKISPGHKQLLEMLNERVGIVKDANALLFPAALHRRVWRERHLVIRESNGELSEKELMGICQRVIKTVPELSRYGKREDVMKDTRNVVLASLHFRKASVI